MRIKSGKFVLPDDFSVEAADLINKLLTQDPRVRMSVQQVLHHSFITKHQPKQLLKRTSCDDLGEMILNDLNPGTNTGQ